MGRLVAACLGALGWLLTGEAALAQLTIAPTAAAQRDAAITAPTASPSPGSTPTAAAASQATTAAPVEACSLSWEKIQAFARGGTILEQGPNCYIHAGPNVFRR